MACMNNNNDDPTSGKRERAQGENTSNSGSDPSSSWFSFHFTPSPQHPSHQQQPCIPPVEQVPFPPAAIPAPPQQPPAPDPRITGQVASEYGEINYILMDRIRVGLDHQSNIAIIQMERDDQSYANLVLLNTKGLVYLIYNLRMILQDMERLYSYIPPTPQM